jgi:hypothetical protein
MLRCGYSSEIILHTLSNRHFAGDLNPAAEKELKAVNASPSLIDALKSGNYAASEEELEQARKRMADAEVAARKAAEQEAADHVQSPVNQRAGAPPEYAWQAAQKLDERVKMVLSSSTDVNEIPRMGFSPDQQRVLHRAVQVAAEEFSNRRDARRGKRIQELMQDETFVRDTLK